MAYTALRQFNSPNYTPYASVKAFYGYPRSIDGITIHWWGDPAHNPSFEGVVSWLCNSRSNVSAHDVITGTGRRIAFIVNNQNAAWHAGSSRGNATTLGFECDPRARQSDYEVVAEDVAETWKYYGRIIPLYPHKHWKATACPGVYDLNKIHSMALAIYNGKPTAPKATEAQIKQAYRDILEREADPGGLKTYLNSGMTDAQVRGALASSQERKDLEARKAAEYAKNEWVRNLQPYVAGDKDYEVLTKLIVTPAQGVKRFNLENGVLLNNEVIPRGTVIDVVAKTTVNGTKYYISSYSRKNGQAVGLRASDLAQPPEPPKDKPEWLQNLKDIEDQDFWTRSVAPVLNLADGTVVENLDMNTKVRITHATQIVGKDLLVIEGTETAIETVYLDDEEIVDPSEDLIIENNNLLKQILELLQQIWATISRVFK